MCSLSSVYISIPDLWVIYLWEIDDLIPRLHDLCSPQYPKLCTILSENLYFCIFSGRKSPTDIFLSFLNCKVGKQLEKWTSFYNHLGLKKNHWLCGFRYWAKCSHVVTLLVCITALLPLSTVQSCQRLQDREVKLLCEHLVYCGFYHVKHCDIWNTVKNWSHFYDHIMLFGHYSFPINFLVEYFYYYFNCWSVLYYLYNKDNYQVIDLMI